MTASADHATPRHGAQVLAFGALVAGALAMAASTVFVRYAAAEGIGPFASAFWRAALALPVLWAWVAWSERAGATGPRGLTRATFLAGLFFAGDLFFWHLAILGTTVANATFLATTAPVWVALGTVLVLRRAVPAASLGGLALCLAGGALLIGHSYSFAPERLLGDAYGLATAVFFGLTILAMGEARRRQGSARVTFLSTAVTAGVLLIVAVALEDRVLPTTLLGWAILLALALISQALGQGLLALALGHLPAVFSALVIFLEAVAAAALGWLLLAEVLTLPQALGGVAILAGIWVARPRGDKAMS